MRFFGTLLRLYSYAFHLALSAFLLGVEVIAVTSHRPPALGVVPFGEDEMVSGVAILGSIGLFSTLLALLRVFRYLFPLWAAWALYLMATGWLAGPYHFDGADAFRIGLWLIAGAAVALLGALSALRLRRGRYI